MTRLVLLEVADVQTQDDIGMAVAIWNDDHPDRQIRILQQTSLIVGEK